MDTFRTDGAFLREQLYGTHGEAAYAGALSFLRRKYTRKLGGVDVAVTGVPFDAATSNRPGARFGPRAIRAASAIMAWGRPYGMEFNPLQKLAAVDYGDCFLDSGRPEQVPEQIEAHAWAIIEQDVSLITLGGDHFISYPLLKAHFRKHGGPLSLLHFDAHNDAWRSPSGVIDHGTMFYHAAVGGLIDPTSSVQIGIRTHSPEAMGFNVLDAPWVHEHGVRAVIEAARGIIGDKPVYLTFDVDCLDPSCAPGTGTPVCGGLSTHQALAVLRGMRGINIIGADIVEVAPAYDVSEITALAAAHVGMEMLCLYASRPDRLARGAETRAKSNQ